MVAERKDLDYYNIDYYDYVYHPDAYDNDDVNVECLYSLYDYEDAAIFDGDASVFNDCNKTMKCEDYSTKVKFFVCLFVLCQYIFPMTGIPLCRILAMPWEGPESSNLGRLRLDQSSTVSST